MSRARSSAAQCSMAIGGVYLAATTIDDAAHAHARRHGLVCLRVECERDLFGAPVEIAVFRTPSGAELRRTADMLASAGTHAAP